MYKQYGLKPFDCGLVDISSKEMMFWLYCPIKLPGGGQVTLPPNLKQFGDIVERVYQDVYGCYSWNKWADNYVYLTAKTLFVSPENPGNRPGWHSDGFMTDDLNYVWSDTNGTLFWEPENLVSFIQDHRKSLAEMENLANMGPHKVYADKHVLRLDQGVIHRVADVGKSGMRTFVKVSISSAKYDLAGNSVNHVLAPNWTYYERNEDRNAPAKSEG